MYDNEGAKNYIFFFMQEVAIAIEVVRTVYARKLSDLNFYDNAFSLNLESKKVHSC